MNTLLLAVLAGTFFGLWPLIMRVSGLNADWIPIIVGIGIFVAGLLVMPDIRDNSEILYKILIGLLAGFVSGLGIVFLGKILADKSASLYLIIVMIVTQMVINTIGASAFFSETITLKRALGILSAILTAILLT